MIESYWKSLSRSAKVALANSLDTSPEYLRHVFLYDKQAGPVMVRGIERETGGVITAAELRPDLFGPLDLPQSASVGVNVSV
jgi:DNA-binding transcriptional regulator YdaS (Cro superfamily)